MSVRLVVCLAGLSLLGLSLVGCGRSSSQNPLANIENQQAEEVPGPQFEPQLEPAPESATTDASEVVASADVKLAVGENTQSGPGETAEGKTDNGIETVALEKPASGIRVAVGDHKDLAKLIKKYQGRVVLVDFWATWCDPCRKKFPHTVALAKQHAEDGLSVISVALDSAEDQSEVEAFLKSQGATFDNLRSKLGDDDAAFEQFDIPDQTIPCIRIYNRKGQAVETMIAPKDKEVAKAVRELLAK